MIATACVLSVSPEEKSRPPKWDAKCRKETEPDMIFLPMHLRVGEIIAPVDAGSNEDTRRKNAKAQ